MKLALFGYGKMGRAIDLLAEAHGHEVIARFNRSHSPKTPAIAQADVCLDFSEASHVLTHLDICLKAQKPLVIGTTGWEENLLFAKEKVEECQGTALYSPNFSLGLTLFFHILSSASSVLETFPEFEAMGIETHHKQKKDAPSGTAKQLASLFSPPLPFISVRRGQFAGKHEIVFDSGNETLHFSHEVQNRTVFAQGALKAAEWILEKKGWWSFDEMVRSLYSTHHSLCQ